MLIRTIQGTRKTKALCFQFSTLRRLLILGLPFALPRGQEVLHVITYGAILENHFQRLTHLCCQIYLWLMAEINVQNGLNTL